MGRHKIWSGRRAKVLLAPVVALVTVGAGALGLTAPAAQANPTTDVGYACGYYTNTSFWGGGYQLQGCKQAANQPSTSKSPTVTLPTSGSGTPVTAADADGARSTNGPAQLFGGPWPADPNNSTDPPSGRIDLSTTGTTTVDSMSQVQAVGPGPFHTGPDGSTTGFVYAHCTATTGNAVTFDVRIDPPTPATQHAQIDIYTDINGVVTSYYNIPTGLNTIPPNTSVNYSLATPAGPGGTTDTGHVVLNERIQNGDGSWTLNAVHMYMAGPNMKGDLIVGQVKCGHP